LTWTLTASRETEADIADAIDWYEEQSPGLGRRFYDDVQRVIGRIANNPLQYAIAYRTSRRALLRRFPYALVFRAEGDEVRLLGCFHTSRSPRKWQARVRRG
jgi:plasmid stabilization system protein ParE